MPVIKYLNLLAQLKTILMRKRSVKTEMPVFIIKVSRNYYKNTLSGTYIRADKIDEYVNKQRDTANKKELPVKNYWWNKD